MRLVDTDATDRKLFYKQCMGKGSLISVESAYDMLMALPEVKAVPIETLVELLEQQYLAMYRYLSLLELRAICEDINLF